MYNYRFFRPLHDLRGQKFNNLDELIKATQLDFEVELRELTYPDSNGTLLGQEYVAAVVRKENDVCLGAASTGYGVVQYKEWFAACEDLITVGGVEPLFGGAPNLGERAWLVFKSGGNISAGGTNIVNHFILSSSHNGQGKLTVQHIPMEAKTGLVLNVESPVLSIKHSKHVKKRVAGAKLILNRTREAWEGFDKIVKDLATIKITDDEAKLFVKSVVGDNDSSKSENVRNKIYDIAKHGISRLYPGCSGTLFGMVLACIEFADNHQTVRKSKYCDESTAALNAKLIGSGAEKKAKAWGAALKLRRLKRPNAA